MKITNNEDGFEALKKQFDADYEAALDFLRSAKEDTDFYEGSQWTDEEIAKMEGGDKPHLVLNLVMRNINAVLGAEISNKRRIVYQPRTTDKNIKGEMMTAAGDWFQDESDSDSVNSDSFADAMISGLGCVDVSLDFSNSPLGRPWMDNIDITSMVIDRDARKCNASDARRAFRLYRMSKADAKALFSAADEADLNFELGNEFEQSKTYREAQLIKGKVLAYDEYFGNEPSETDYCTICEARWIEDGKPYYLTADWKVIEPEAYEAMPQRPAAVKMFRKQTRRAWLGKKFLRKIDEPLCEPGRLGWLFISCFYSRSERKYFGMIKNVRDAQRMVNRYYSQMIYTMDKASKGGLLAEAGAFEDINEAEKKWSSSDSIIPLKEGGLNKIKDKPLGQIPAGVKDILDRSYEAIGDVQGISQEFVGTREANQPNVLEQTRKESTLNVLAILYNNLTRYRVELGKAILYLIQNYVPDGTLLRLNDVDNAKYIKLVRADITQQEYDLVIDEVPNSMSEKDRLGQVLPQVITAAMGWVQQGMPMDTAMTILSYMPIPQTLINKLMTQAAEAQQQQAQAQSQQPDPSAQAQQAALQLKQAELSQKAQADQLKAQLGQAEIEKDLQVAQIAANSRLQAEAIKHGAATGEPNG